MYSYFDSPLVLIIAIPRTLTKLNDIRLFKVNEDKKFRKQLIDNVIKYAHDYMSLITAAVLIKKKFNIEELTLNYDANVDAFQGNWY